jgi:hypothetical protein
MAAVAMSSGAALKQGVSLGKSEFCGNVLKRQAAAASRGQNVTFAVRAAGYTEELIATAVRFLVVLANVVAKLFVSCY